jgi:hypothetical protein
MRKGASTKGYRGKLQDIEVVVSGPDWPAWIAPDTSTAIPGLVVTQTAEPQHREQSADFEHFDDYRSVRLRGRTFPLTATQAKIIEILHDASERRMPDVGIHYILSEVESLSSRMADLFKSNKEAKKALIRVGERRGTYRLNL